MKTFKPYDRPAPKTNRGGQKTSICGLVLVGQLAFAICGSAQSWNQTTAPDENWAGIASSADGMHLVAVANNFPGAIYVSADGGITWSNASAPDQSWTGVASSSDGMKLVAVGNDYPGAICVSSDGGATWSNASAPTAEWTGVACSADGTEVVAVANDYPNGPIYVSADSGNTWQLTDAPSSSWASVAASADGTKWVAAGNNYPQGPVYISTNSGFNWIQTTAPSEEWESVASSADASVQIVVGNNYPQGPLCVSTNSGADWSFTSAPADNYFAVTCSADGTRLVAASQYISGVSGVIYLSRDKGRTWQSMDAPQEIWSGLASSADGTRLAAVVNGGGIYTWQSAPFYLNAIDVLCSRTTFASATGNGTNNGIVPYSYTPGLQYLSPVSGASYDAADTNDTGTAWNTLICPSTSVANTTGSNLTTLYEQNLPLTDSLGNSSKASLSVSFTENTGKTDTIHNAGMDAGTNPGSDGLPASPSALMGQSWVDNGTSEFITFTVSGLIAGAAYDLYIYGAGPTNGYGGTYSLAAANQPGGYAPVSTQPGGGTIYRSVFDTSGTNPAPNIGLSWNFLPAVADGNGNLSFNVNKDAGSGVKGSINGFQIAFVPGSTPSYITSIELQGSNLVISGANGTAGQSCVVLMTTDLGQPGWTAVATNQISGNGSFTIIATNAVSAGAVQQFYRLQTQ